MRYYTEEQVLKMVRNGVSTALNYTSEFSSDETTETINLIADGAMLDPSTLDIQKQIEAVRGLIEAHNNLTSIVMTRYGGDGEFEDEISTLNDSIRTLTETLKPHLNGEKLEV